MPRKERTIRPRSIVAAAKNYTTGRSAERISGSRVRPGEEWQRAGWDFFDTVPEYHQGCSIIGSLLSRARLIPLEKQKDGTWGPTKNPVVVAALDELYGGEEGQAEMLQQLGIHLAVAGEGWLVGPGDDGDGDTDVDDWIIAASTEISKNGSTWKVATKEIKGNPLVVRIHRRHPRDPQKADAPTRAVLPVLSELLQLTKRIAAQIDSRLFGAGLLLLPSETSFPASPVRSINPGDPEAPPVDSIQSGDAQGLADLIFETAQYAIDHPESAAAMIPLIGQTPGEYIGNVKHITFWSELDRMAPKLRGELIGRLALGMDIPPEMLTGAGGSNRWNAWLSDENSVKIHAEPLLKMITTGLTTGYLRKAIEGEPGIDDPQRFAIGSDTSQMRLRPNRSKEALELHKMMILSAEATLRENGFNEADRMEDDEYRKALVHRAASGSTTPELVEAALRVAGVDLDVQITDFRQPTEARPTPSLKDHPVRELPDENYGALVFAAEQMVDRALQRAGNRMKRRLGASAGALSANRLYTAANIKTADLPELLEDAWGSVSDFDYGVDPTRLTRALDFYTRSVLLSGKAPTRAGIAAALKVLL